VNFQPPPANAVAFVDARYGWVGGGAGLLGTTDGRTFRVETHAPIIGITAIARRRAWALTGDGFVLRTTDGRYWGRLGAPHLIQLQFVDAHTGFALTRDGILVRSTDAGGGWPQIRAPGLVQSECFSTPRDGWVARGGSVWTTHDTGRHWIRARLRVRTGTQELPELGCKNRDAWVVFREGAAAGTEGYRVYASFGGGRWRPVLASPFQRTLPTVSNYIGPFSILGSGRAVFSGWCAPCDGFGTLSITRTLNQARSWWRSTPLRGYEPKAVGFTDAENGWLVSGGHGGSASAARVGILWRTRDGGRHWRIVVRSALLRDA
jgi:hypothetical protein